MATPTRFLEANRTLTAPAGQPDVLALEVWTDGERVVSRWRMTWRERLSALVFGRAWISVLAGETHPPIALSVERTYFAPVEPGPHD